MVSIGLDGSFFHLQGGQTALDDPANGLDLCSTQEQCVPSFLLYLDIKNMKKIKTMNSKITTNSQLSTTEPKNTKSKPKTN